MLGIIPFYVIRWAPPHRTPIQFWWAYLHKRRVTSNEQRAVGNRYHVIARMWTCLHAQISEFLGFWLLRQIEHGSSVTRSEIKLPNWQHCRQTPRRPDPQRCVYVYTQVNASIYIYIYICKSNLKKVNKMIWHISIFVNLHRIIFGYDTIVVFCVMFDVLGSIVVSVC